MGEGEELAELYDRREVTSQSGLLMGWKKGNNWVTGVTNEDCELASDNDDGPEELDEESECGSELEELELRMRPCGWW